VNISLRSALGLLAVTVIAAAVPLANVAPAFAAVTVPYTDPNSSGTIGLCDKNGHTITSGRITDNPFAWTAVSSTPAPAGFRGTEHKAVLAAFLPMQGLDPGNWSGKYLTANSLYTNLSHPMAAATVADGPLSWFVAAFPPRWNGLVQLRMYLSAYNAGIENSSYPTTDIRVTGKTWTVVRGGTGSCTVGKAVSLETVKLTQQQIDHIAGVTPSPSTHSSPTSGATASSGTAALNSAAAQGANAGSPSSVDSSSSAGTLGPAIGLLAVAVLGVLAGLFVWWRRRSSPPPQP